MGEEFYEDPRVVEFAAHMEILRDKGINKCARIADFELMEIYNIAPSIVVLDVEGRPVRYRIRFAGTFVVGIYGSETTGLFLDDLNLGSNKQKLIDIYDQLLKSRRPQWTRTLIVKDKPVNANQSGQQVFAYQRLSYPLVDEDDTIQRIVSIIAHQLASGLTVPFESRELN